MVLAMSLHFKIPLSFLFLYPSLILFFFFFFFSRAYFPFPLSVYLFFFLIFSLLKAKAPQNPARCPIRPRSINLEVYSTTSLTNLHPVWPLAFELKLLFNMRKRSNLFAATDELAGFNGALGLNLPKWLITFSFFFF